MLMKQMANYGDDRQKGFCVHCGGSTETRDHAPSKVLLDKPYPANLPILPCCQKCNEGFSLDEEYLACFVECIVSGLTEPSKLQRDNIKRILNVNSSLRASIEQAKEENLTLFGEKEVFWKPQEARARNVVMKLVRCHVAYELNEPRLDDPQHIMVTPLPQLNDIQRSRFESLPDTHLWPEAGSRAMQRLLIEDKAYSEGWITVQQGRYRYMTVGAEHVMVRGVLSEYLAYEVIWE